MPSYLLPTLFVSELTGFLHRSMQIPRIVFADLALNAIRNPNRLRRQQPQIASTPDDSTCTLVANFNGIPESFQIWCATVCRSWCVLNPLAACLDQFCFGHFVLSLNCHTDCGDATRIVTARKFSGLLLLLVISMRREVIACVQSTSAEPCGRCCPCVVRSRCGIGSKPTRPAHTRGGRLLA